MAQWGLGAAVEPVGRGFNGIIEIFHWLQPSSRSMAMLSEYFLGRKGCLCVGLTTFLPSSAECLEMLEASNSWRGFEASNGNVSVN